jgi:hypothetical protein
MLLGAAYAWSGRYPSLLWAVNLALASTGSATAGPWPAPRQALPRYGFYVDHVSDVFGAFPWPASRPGHIAPAVASGLLVAYLLFSVNLYLKPTLGRFKMSYGRRRHGAAPSCRGQRCPRAWPRVAFGHPVRLFDSSE